MQSDFDANWNNLAQEVLLGMKEWRLQHPKATLKEIETVLTTSLARLEAKMLEDLALASPVANLSQTTLPERPTCPQCHKPLTARGQQRRQLITHHDQTLNLKRTSAYCPECRLSFFPPG
jgi:RNase P subunit RPR2